MHKLEVSVATIGGIINHRNGVRGISRCGEGSHFASRVAFMEVEVLEGKATIFSDSQSAIHLSRNLVHHKRTMQVDIKFHFVRDSILKGEIELKKVPTDDNPVDMGTTIVTALLEQIV